MNDPTWYKGRNRKRQDLAPLDHGRPDAESHSSTLLRKKNMVVHGSYSSYILLKSGTLLMST